MRWLAPIVLLACGCTFDFDGLALPSPDLSAEVDLAAADDLAGDDGGADDLATPPDLTALDLASVPDLAVPFCSEPSVVGCWEFEDGTTATTARDGSPSGLDLTLSGGAAEFLGGYRGAALQINAGGLAHAAHKTALDVSRLTVEAWVRPTTLPGSGARAGILDVDGQYGVFLYPGGVLTCSLSASVSSAAGAIEAVTWTHVACTDDGTTVRVYKNGVQIASGATSAALKTNQPNGLSVGSNSPNGDELMGLVDQVRIFSVARSAAQICSDAGRTGC